MADRGALQRADGVPQLRGRILTAALRAARAITDEGSKAVALARVAEALTAADPDRAESIAQVITSESWKAVALGRKICHGKKGELYHRYERGLENPLTEIARPLPSLTCRYTQSYP